MEFTAGAEPVAQARARGLTFNAALAAAGGCMDAFTYVGHGHVFANAMTGNVILLAIYLANGRWQQALRHVPPIVTFLIGVAAARAVSPSRLRQISAVLLTEIALFFGLSFLPDGFSDFFIVTVICFAASLQTGTFRHVGVSSYNSTFTTGNLRTLSESFFDWTVRNRTLASLKSAAVSQTSRNQTIEFAIICFAFFGGAVLGGIVTPRLQNRTLWLITAALSAAFVWLALPAKPPWSKTSQRY